MDAEEKAQGLHRRALAIVRDSLHEEYRSKPYYTNAVTAGELLDEVENEFLNNRVARSGIAKAKLVQLQYPGRGQYTLAQHIDRFSKELAGYIELKGSDLTETDKKQMFVESFERERLYATMPDLASIVGIVGYTIDENKETYECLSNK